MTKLFVILSITFLHWQPEGCHSLSRLYYTTSLLSDLHQAACQCILTSLTSTIVELPDTDMKSSTYVNDSTTPATQHRSYVRSSTIIILRLDHQFFFIDLITIIIIIKSMVFLLSRAPRQGRTTATLFISLLIRLVNKPHTSCISYRFANIFRGIDTKVYQSHISDYPHFHTNSTDGLHVVLSA